MRADGSQVILLHSLKRGLKDICSQNYQLSFSHNTFHNVKVLPESGNTSFSICTESRDTLISSLKGGKV